MTEDSKDPDIQEVMREEKSRGKTPRRYRSTSVSTQANGVASGSAKIENGAGVCGCYARAWTRRRPREIARGFEDLARFLLSSATFNSNACHRRPCSSTGRVFM